MPNSLAPDAWGLVGSVLDGRYRIERVAGHGGHGVVYRALHLGFDIPVAVKVLRPPDSENDSSRQALRESFHREGQILSRLCALHPAFVQAREAGTLLRSDGSTAPYLVLEWLDGVGLDREIKERRALDTSPLELADAIGLLDSAAQGLALAHARGISHRDLKPGNLFVVAQDGTAKVKILDLGLAKVMEDTLSTAARFIATRDNRHAFTHAYGAPEQWLSRLGASGPWTDVHAWALVCVELITGKRALIGHNSEQLMGACLDATRPSLQRAGVEVSDAVEAVFTRAFAVQPSERYADLGEFWQALCTAAGVAEPRSLEATKLVVSCPISPSSKTKTSVVLETAPPTASVSGGFATASRPARQQGSVGAAFGAAAVLCTAGGWLTLRAVATPTVEAARTALTRPAVSRLGAEPREASRKTKAALEPVNRRDTSDQEPHALPGLVAPLPQPTSTVSIARSRVLNASGMKPSAKRASVEPPSVPNAAGSVSTVSLPPPLPSSDFRPFD